MSWFCAFSFIGIILLMLGVADMIIEHYHYDLKVIEPKYLMGALTLTLGSLISIVTVGVCIHRKHTGKRICCHCCKNNGGKRRKIIASSNGQLTAELLVDNENFTIEEEEEGKIEEEEKEEIGDKNNNDDEIIII